MKCLIINRVLLLSIVILSNISYSQNNLDSLLSEFHSTENEIIKIECLNEIGDILYDHNKDSSELVWHQALIMSNKTLDDNHDYSEKEILLLNKFFIF